MRCYSLDDHGFLEGPRRAGDSNDGWGNIAGYTRVMTTAIALGVSRRGFEEALALGLVLLAIMVVSSIAIKLVGGVRVSWSMD